MSKSTARIVAVSLTVTALVVAGAISVAVGHSRDTVAPMSLVAPTPTPTPPTHWGSPARGADMYERLGIAARAAQVRAAEVAEAARVAAEQAAAAEVARVATEQAAADAAATEAAAAAKAAAAKAATATPKAKTSTSTSGAAVPAAPAPAPVAKAPKPAPVGLPESGATAHISNKSCRVDSDTFYLTFKLSFDNGYSETMTFAQPNLPYLGYLTAGDGHQYNVDEDFSAACGL